MATTGMLRRLSIPALLIGAALFQSSCATQRGPLTLEEANARRLVDGTLDRYVYTKEKPGGRRTTPKYANKSWDWFVSRRLPLNSEERALPKLYREKAYEVTLERNMNTALLRDSRAANWRAIHISGDVQPSGRMIELAVHPTNDSIIYAATASGGVYKTTNRGDTWTAVTDTALPTLGIGSIAMDPSNPETLYIGMGEGVPGSHYEPYGSGIWRTTNGGANWSLVNGTSGFPFVSDIAILNNGQTILAAAAGAIQGGTDFGFFRSTDGGNSWTKTLNLPTVCISPNPADSSNIVVTTKQGQTDYARIHVSTDGGASFTNATIPGNQNIFRIELTRNGNTMYAVAGKNDGSLGGVWKSTNGGVSWTATGTSGIPASGDYAPGQMYYNCSIAVSPFDANVVYLGSNLRMYRTTNGGTSWSAVTDWAGDEGLPYMHADHHSIRFGQNQNTVLIGNDGGFYLTTDGFATVQERNIGMEALQIYRMDNHPTDANALVFGLQDNDKYVRRSDGSWRHYPNSFGDCMEVIAHPSSPNTFFGCNYNGVTIRITEDGSNTQWPVIRGYGSNNNGIPDNDRGSWISPFIYDPKNPNTLYLGLNGVYRTTYTPGLMPQWQQIIGQTSNLTPRQMESMTITMGDSNRKLVGFYGRQGQSGLTVALWRANPDGSGQEILDTPQAAWVSDIEADPNNNNVLWITYSDINAGFGNRGRIYKSTDLGTSWQNMTNDFPPGLPASAIFVDPNNSNTIFVGSDIGVYRSDNGGQNWVYWNTGMPPAVVTDFAYFAPSRRLRAATYGRGLFETEIDGPAAEPEIRIAPESLNFD